MSRRPKAFWALFLATCLIYLVMFTWSAPRLVDLASGELLPDARPFGYSADEMRAYLDKLGQEGRLFYLNVQWRLDSVFPALMALTLLFALLRLYPAVTPRVRSVLIILAFAGAVFDYLENYHVAGLMVRGPDLLDPAKVAAASFATTLKWLFYVLALGAALAGILRRVRRSGSREAT